MPRRARVWGDVRSDGRAGSPAFRARQACASARAQDSSPVSPAAADDGRAIIACSTLRDELEPLRGGLPVEYVDGLLHDTPGVLRETLNARIAEVPGACTVLLAYARCSNGTAGLVAGPHRLVLPACDDCIALLLGSRAAYKREFAAHPGTYYYTRGWIEEVRDPYQVYLKLTGKYGEEKARRLALMELANYTRLAIVDTGSYDLRPADEYVGRVADLFDLPVQHLPGSLRLLEKLVHGPHDDEFIVVEPGQTLDESRFWSLDG
jgi:hypothetical protein